MALLDDFYYGNIIPGKQVSSNEKEPDAQAVSMEKNIRELLPDDKHMLIDEYINRITRINAIDMKDNFLFGFRYGILMMIEVFRQSDDLL